MSILSDLKPKASALMVDATAVGAGRKITLKRVCLSSVDCGPSAHWSVVHSPSGAGVAGQGLGTP